jgi:hypothetical protein
VDASSEKHGIEGDEMDLGLKWERKRSGKLPLARRESREYRVRRRTNEGYTLYPSQSGEPGVCTFSFAQQDHLHLQSRCTRHPFFMMLQIQRPVSAETGTGAIKCDVIRTHLSDSRHQGLCRVCICI